MDFHRIQTDKFLKTINGPLETNYQSLSQLENDLTKYTTSIRELYNDAYFPNNRFNVNYIPNNEFMQLLKYCLIHDPNQWDNFIRFYKTKESDQTKTHKQLLDEIRELKQENQNIISHYETVVAQLNSELSQWKCDWLSSQY